MGPREFTRGDLINEGGEGFDPSRLQWGRGSSPAETQWVLLDGLRVVTASMGPREFTRGDGAVAAQLVAEDRLQWGRGSSPAETLLALEQLVAGILALPRERVPPLRALACCWVGGGVVSD